jgi:glutamine cyclotransferase
MTLIKRADKGEALTYQEMDGNLTHLGGDGSYQFPATDGQPLQVLQTDGNGQLSFVDISEIHPTYTVTDITGSVFAKDSTLLVDADTGEIVGDVRANIYAQDSQLLVDSQNGTIPGYVSLATLKQVVADSTDFDDFKKRISNL